MDFLLSKIEESGAKISDICLELLLSYNQPFTEPTANSVMIQLSHKLEATLLTQRFLKWFNAGGESNMYYKQLM